MILDILVILAVVIGGGLLLFPVKVRFSFRGQKNENRFAIHLFHKKIFSTEEDRSAESSEIDDAELRASEEDDFDAENPWKNESSKVVEAKAPVEEKSEKPAPKKNEEPVKNKAEQPSTKRRSRPNLQRKIPVRILRTRNS